MNPNPAIGVLYHWLGGLASGSFYVPYRGVKRWAWETFWLTGGFFSWIIAPWFFGLLMTKDLLAVLHETPGTVLFWTFFFGLLWGVGGLTFGLTMRYLGLSLGMAVVLGLCAAFGTLIPPIFRGEFMTQVVGTTSGRVILLGIFVCLLGIAAAGVAGIFKERNMSPEQQKVTIKEFDLKKGVGVATLSGVMSACFAYGLAAGDPIKTLTMKHGTPDLWQGLPVLVVVLIGGFTTNFIWCLILNIRNKTGYQYFTSVSREPDGTGPIADETIIETALDAPSREVVEHIAPARAGLRQRTSTAVADPPVRAGHESRPHGATRLSSASSSGAWSRESRPSAPFPEARRRPRRLPGPSGRTETPHGASPTAGKCRGSAARSSSSPRPRRIRSELPSSASPPRVRPRDRRTTARPPRR